MAIYDNNGTTSAEIGKLYDNNGTTDYQIGKVYDNDGTTNHEIYTADVAFFDNGALLRKPDYVWKGNDGGSYSIGSSYIYVKSAGDWDSIYLGWYEDLTGYSTLTCNVAGCWGGGEGATMQVVINGSADIKSGSNPTCTRRITGSTSGASTITVDVSDLSGKYYCYFGVYNHRGQIQANISKFVLS